MGTYDEKSWDWMNPSRRRSPMDSGNNPRKGCGGKKKVVAGIFLLGLFSLSGLYGLGQLTAMAIRRFV